MSTSRSIIDLINAGKKRNKKQQSTSSQNTSPKSTDSFHTPTSKQLKPANSAQTSSTTSFINPNAIQQPIAMENTVSQNFVGFGAPPCAFNPTEISTFLGTTQATLKAAQNLIATTQSEEMKVMLQLLIQTTQSCGYLLSREISVGVSKALESDKRAHELVVAGIPESELTTPTGRAEDDRKKALEILDTVGTEILPIAVYRLGKPSAGRPRLTKIQLPTKFAVTFSLRNRSKLSNNPNTQKYFMRNSMSAEERMTIKALAAEKIEKNKQLDDDGRKNPYIVYAGKLMRRSEIDEWKRSKR